MLACYHITSIRGEGKSKSAIHSGCLKCALKSNLSRGMNNKKQEENKQILFTPSFVRFSKVDAPQGVDATNWKDGKLEGWKKAHSSILPPFLFILKPHFVWYIDKHYSFFFSKLFIRERFFVHRNMY